VAQGRGAEGVFRGRWAVGAAAVEQLCGCSQRQLLPPID